MAVFIYGRTKKCCKCGAIATEWQGWLRKSRDGIKAGFCRLHLPPLPNVKRHDTYGPHNCYGIYHKGLGEDLSNKSGEEIIKQFGLDKNLNE